MVLGDGGADWIVGGSGSDRLFGGAGGDVLFGDDEDDVIFGGAGPDQTYGGTGKDDFYFTDGDFSGNIIGTADWIRDFNPAEGDNIELRQVDADTTTAGDQAFTFIGGANFTGTAGELRYELHDNASTQNMVVYGDTDGDGAADFAIRLTGHVTLQADDFWL